MNFKLLPLIPLLLLIISCSKDNTQEDVEGKDFVAAQSLFNIKYGEEIGQTYDLYLPANRSSGTTKVLVLIHGGGWIQGDKDDMNTYIPLLQELHPTHALVNLNYRLAIPPAQAAFPQQFLDLQKAIDHLKETAAELGIKPEFGLIGASAGAHLALQFDSVYDIYDDVKMVCSIVGPTNFTDTFYTENPDFSMALDFLVDETAYPEVTDLASAVSPALLVTSKNSPTILFYGKNDPLVPITNGRFLKEKLDAAGIINRLTIYEGGHGNWENSSNSNMQSQLSDFIDDHLAMNPQIH